MNNELVGVGTKKQPMHRYSLLRRRRKRKLVSVCVLLRLQLIVFMEKVYMCGVLQCVFVPVTLCATLKAKKSRP